MAKRLYKKRDVVEHVEKMLTAVVDMNEDAKRLETGDNLQAAKRLIKKLSKLRNKTIPEVYKVFYKAKKDVVENKKKDGKPKRDNSHNFKNNNY